MDEQLYDIYGRPVMARTQRLPTPTYQPNSLEARFEKLETNFARLEALLNGTAPVRNSNQPFVPNGPQPIGTPAQNNDVRRSTQASPFIEVKSQDEAWQYEVEHYRLMGMGEKFYFHNKVANEFYCKWFDAENAEMMKEVYRKVPKAVSEKQVEKVLDNTVIDTVLFKVNSIEEQLSQILMLASMFKPEMEYLPAKEKPSKRNGKGQFQNKEECEPVYEPRIIKESDEEC